jgi:iron complex outermembrane recepter protein
VNKIALAVSCTLALAATTHAAENDEILDEVTVFAERARAATKTDTKLVEIPQSISVVTAEQIEERGALNYQDVFRYSAGVDTERFGADTRSDDFSARGFPVVQYLDGLNRTPDVLYGARIEVFTLERAEVLRGPSAVLYGAGSSGGLLNAVSKRPQFDFGGELGLEFGTQERKQVQMDVAGPLSESLAGRFVGVYRDGELQSEGQANDKIVAMPSITWRPGANTEITAIVLYQKEDLGTQTYLPLSKTLRGDGSPRLAVDFFVGEPDFNRMKTDHAAGTLIIQHRFNDWMSASSQSRYFEQEVDYGEVYGSYYSGMDPFVDAAHTLLAREFYILDEDYQVANTDNHLVFEFETGPVSHKVLAGVDYTKFEQDRREGFSCRGVTDGSFACFTGGSPPPLNVYDPDYGQPFDVGFTNAYTTRSTQLGYYLQDQVKYGPAALVLGARRDRATSQASGGSDDVNKATTFRAGLIVEVIAGVSPYASYSESFQPVFGGDFFGVPFKPREGRQYEVGIKWQPSAQSLVSLAWFDIEEDNFVTADPDNIQNFVQAGAVGAKGYEFEAILNLWSSFNVTLNYSHTEAEVLKGTISHPAGDQIEDLPEDLASLWLSKAFDINAEWAARIGGGARYVGQKIDFYQRLQTPSVTLADAALEITHADWDFALNVNNLFDKEFYAICAEWSPPDGVCHPGLSRSIVASLRRKF